MRLPWAAVIAVGVILVGAGAYTTLASQSAIDYVKSCANVVACGTVGNPKPQFFLSDTLTASLQEAQLAWLAGFAVIGLGLVSIAYGVYLYSQARARSPLVETGVVPP